jgi:NADH-quinone oxidoreductase subunit J
MLDALFYMLAIGTVGCAVAALFIPHVVHSILFLIGAFFNASGLFLLLGAEFLAFVLIIVYVGAVALLFLFIIMTLDGPSPKTKRAAFYKNPPLFIGLFLFVEIIVVFTAPSLTLPILEQGGRSNTHAIGDVLYTHYFFPFQMVGVILLAAMVAAIALIWQRSHGKKRQNMGHQAAVHAKDRLTLKEASRGEGVSE